MDQNKLFQRLYLNAVAGLNALDRICIEDIVNGEILPTCLSQSNIETLAQKRIDPSQWDPESWKRKAEELVSLCEKQAISCIRFLIKPTLSYYVKLHDLHICCLFVETIVY